MRTLSMFGLVVALAMPGCSWFSGDKGEKGEKAAPVSAEEIKKAVSVAKAIKKDPENAAAALKEAGMSRVELEELAYKIALDEAASEKYAKALREGK